MSIGDKLSSWQARLAYSYGSWRCATLIGSMGTNCQIHHTVSYTRPSGIVIGNNCEIRANTFLDARSPKTPAIVLGDGCRIKDSVGFATYGGEIRLGSNVLVNRCSMIFGHGGVYVGDYSMLSPNVVIVSDTQLAYLSDTPFQDQGFTRDGVTIGHNVWIGANSTILPGTRIEPNTVIAAGAVVKGHLEGGWVWGGNPARAIRRLDKDKPEGVQVQTKNWGLFT